MILVLIGMGLEQLHAFVAVVLMSLGATLVVAAPLALLPVWALAATAVVTLLVGSRRQRRRPRPRGRRADPLPGLW